MRVATACALAVAGLLLRPPAQVIGQISDTGPVSGRLAGGVSVYQVRHGDSLTRVGARFGADVRVMARDNGLSSDAFLEIGQTLVIDNRHIVPPPDDASIVVNVPQRMLFLFEADGASAFPVAVGRRTWRTPLGPFHITAKEEAPVWDVPPSIRAELRRAGRPAPERVPPGPGNPLGGHWLGLTLPSIGIHGTSQPASIYRAATHGCIRMHDEDVHALFARIAVGAAGRIVYLPVLFAQVGDGVYLEVHADVYGLGVDGASLLRAWADAAGLSDRIDWKVAGEVLRARDGIARPIASRSRDLTFTHEITFNDPQAWRLHGSALKPAKGSALDVPASQGRVP